MEENVSIVEDEDLVVSFASRLGGELSFLVLSHIEH